MDQFLENKDSEKHEKRRFRDSGECSIPPSSAPAPSTKVPLNSKAPTGFQCPHCTYAAKTKQGLKNHCKVYCAAARITVLNKYSNPTANRPTDQPLIPNVLNKPKAVDIEENGAIRTLDMKTNGFPSVRSQPCATHVTNSEKNVKRNADKMRSGNIRSTQGMHGKNAVKKVKINADKMKSGFMRSSEGRHSRNAVKQSSNLAIETLEDHETLDCDNDLFFNDPVEEIESWADQLDEISNLAIETLEDHETLEYHENIDCDDYLFWNGPY